jgi:hypothetical protein
VTLASALVRVLELETAHAGPGPALPLAAASSLAGDPGLVERRVERLLEPPAPSLRPWGAPAVAAAGIAAILPFLTAWFLGIVTSCLHHA